VHYKCFFDDDDDDDDGGLRGTTQSVFHQVRGATEAKNTVQYSTVMYALIAVAVVVAIVINTSTAAMLSEAGTVLYSVWKPRTAIIIQLWLSTAITCPDKLSM